MKIGLKYFIVLVFLYSCKRNHHPVTEENPSLYPEPIMVPLNTTERYAINQLTGDTIKPLLNSFGEIVRTGVTIHFNGVSIRPETMVRPNITRPVSPATSLVGSNTHPIPSALTVITVDSSKLKKIKFGEGDQSFVLRNSMGVIKSGVWLPVTGRKMPFSEPQPVKAATMRYKDNATTNIQYLNVDQGLTYAYVLDLLEDKKGNFWFGMDGTGITKYDGVSFTNYTVKEGLTGGNVMSIMEDRKGNIWIGTFDGLTKFDGETFTQFTEKEGLCKNKILSLLEDSKGMIWIASEGGVTRYDGKKFMHYTRKEGLPCDSVFTCKEDRNGNIWFGTYYGVAKFDGNSFTHFTQKDGLPMDYIFSILPDRNGNIWLGSITGGVSKYDGKKMTQYTEKEGLSINNVWSMMQDRSGNIWLTTSFGGLNKFDGKNFTHYDLEEGLSNNKVRKIIEDKNGNLWMATDGGGVNKLNKNSFQYLLPESLFVNNRVRPIVEDKKGSLWMGTEGGGVGKYDAGNMREGKKLFTYYKEKDGLPARGQRAFLQDKNGNIWIGTSGGGLSKFDGEKFNNYTLDPEARIVSVYSILEDKKGTLWFGTSIDGIYTFDRNTLPGNQYGVAHFTEKEGLPCRRIFSMLEDKKDNLWFCTEGGGLCKYDGKNIIVFTEREGLFCKSITSITEDGMGNLWLGTLGAGVCKFDGNYFTYYTEQQGLINNNVWSVQADSTGQIWAGTDKGLALFIPRKDSLPGTRQPFIIQNFGSMNGLKAVDFNLHSVCIDKNDRAWWGTGQGVPSLDLHSDFRALDASSINLSYLEINDRYYDFRNLPDSVRKNIAFERMPAFSNCPDGLTIAHNLNQLSFHFSAIDWSAPEKIKYSFRLLGLNKRWSKPAEEPIAVYRNLNHGKYQFQVRAVGQSQVWTPVLSYPFIIRPAWWQTWWFRALIVAALLTLIFFIGRFIYFYQLRKQQILLEKRLAVQFERQRISSEMHDDIGAGLSGIRLMTEMARNKAKDQPVNTDIEKIYESVGDISSKMKEVIWSLNADNDSLGSLLLYLQKQIRHWLENYPGHLAIEIPDHVPTIEISGEYRRNIYLAIKEAIHNIIKHSGADKIDVAISCMEDLVISVTDNGKSLFSLEDGNGGIGLKNMKQRMEKIGGSFTLQQEKGTTVILKIPLGSTR
ncbi:MAG TPA: two-component regulator propeller domain-containing protein [Chitinophagaceae bacterium]|nr:two-component regulator propeller domain-containing protein [Chitinophagaceae bacterium]